VLADVASELHADCVASAAYVGDLNDVPCSSDATSANTRASFYTANKHESRGHEADLATKACAVAWHSRIKSIYV
jgi:hypothetical protein